MNIKYAPATDRKGNSLAPGDNVSFRLWPKGSARGTVVVSERAFEVVDGENLPALSILSENTRYPIYSRGVLKLAKQNNEGIV